MAKILTEPLQRDENKPSGEPTPMKGKEVTEEKWASNSPDEMAAWEFSSTPRLVSIPSARALNHHDAEAQVRKCPVTRGSIFMG